MAQVMPARSAVPREHTWDVASIFPSEQDWEAEFKHVEEQLPGLARFRQCLGSDPTILADYLEAAERIGIALGKVTLYASMQHTVDTADQAAVAKNDRARGLGARAAAAMSFAEPEILAIGREKLNAWMQAEKRLPIYAHYVDRLEHRRPHVRDTATE